MTKEQKKEFKKLEEKAKDCGVQYGIYSKKYADAIKKMNDYWLDANDRNKTFIERVKIKMTTYYYKMLK